MANEKTNAEKNLYMGAGVYAPEVATGAEIPFFRRYTFSGASQADEAAQLLSSPSFRSYWSQGMTDNNHLTRLGRALDRIVPKALRMGDIPETLSGVRVSNPNDIALTNAFNAGKLDFTTPYKPKFLPSDYQLSGMDAQGNNTYSLVPNAKNVNKTYWDLRNVRGAELAEDRALLSILKYRNNDPASGLTRYVANNNADDVFGLSEELARHTNQTSDFKVVPKSPAKIIFRDGWFRPQMDLSQRIMQANDVLEAERQAVVDAELMAGGVRPPVNAGEDVAPIGANAKPKPFVARTDANEERTVGRITNNYKRRGPKLPFDHTTEIYGPPKITDILKARGQQALRLGARGLTGLAILATPFDAVARRNEYFRDYYTEHGKEPSDLMGAGIRLRAGLEPVLNAATFGAYDTRRNVQGIMDTTTGLQEAEFIKANRREPTEKERGQMLQDQYQYSGFYM